MIKNNLLSDPINHYHEIIKNIVFLKEKNKKIMNKITYSNESSDFWWLITGQYAIHAYQVELFANKDARILNDIKNEYETLIPAKKISTIILKIIARDSVFGLKNYENKNNNNQFDINSILIDNFKYNFEKKDFKYGQIHIPFNFLCNVLFTIVKAKQSIFSQLNNLKKKIDYNIFKKERPKLNFKYNKNTIFETVFFTILPKDILNNFPSWFSYFSKFLVGDKHKWITYFGCELNLYQKVLLARSFSKFNDKNIEVISHGYMGGEIDSHLIHILSLFPDLKIKSNIPNVNLINKSRNDLINNKQGILFCPFQIPWVSEYLSLESLNSLMKVYSKVINILSEGVKLGKKIKIRYKDNEYLSGYAGQLSSEELTIPVEENNFEKIYQNYSSVITMPCGSIFKQCEEYNINCVAFNHPVVPTDRSMFNEINKKKNVFNEPDSFLREIQNLVNKLPKNLNHQENN